MIVPVDAVTLYPPGEDVAAAIRGSDLQARATAALRDLFAVYGARWPSSN